MLAFRSYDDYMDYINKVVLLLPKRYENEVINKNWHNERNKKRLEKPA